MNLYASIIVSSPKTGEILALGNVPTFDRITTGVSPRESKKRVN